mgnify:CR=1 FL=1
MGDSATTAAGEQAGAGGIDVSLDALDAPPSKRARGGAGQATASPRPAVAEPDARGGSTVDIHDESSGNGASAAVPSTTGRSTVVASDAPSAVSFGPSTRSASLDPAVPASSCFACCPIRGASSAA